MAIYEGQQVFATCRIVGANRAIDGTMNYIVHADFTRQVLQIVPPEAGPNSMTYSDEVIVNTSIEPTDSEISAALRAGTAAQLELREPYGWTEADIRGLSL